MEDLADLPTVRFTQEKDEYLYYSENFVDTSASSQMFNVTDRATLNGIWSDRCLCNRFWILDSVVSMALQLFASRIT